MDFRSAQELLALCRQTQRPISELMRRRECELGETTRDQVDHRMARVLEIMRESASLPLKKPAKSTGGLIGGESKKLHDHAARGKAICGDVLQRAMTYAMGVAEVNASMGLIVAAPTAGSAGVVPGLLLALQDCYKISDDRLIDALFNAGAVGYLAMRNATVAGAVGGCQAEVGVAAAMAASATVELMGGTPEQCLDAASTVLMNLLGLVCDPVGNSSSPLTRCWRLCTPWAAASPSSCGRPPWGGAPQPPPPAPAAAAAADPTHTGRRDKVPSPCSISLPFCPSCAIMLSSFKIQTVCEVNRHGKVIRSRSLSHPL